MKEELKDSKLSTSELCKRYLRYQLAHYNATASQHSSSVHGGNVVSLTIATARKIRLMLASSEALDEDLVTLLTSANRSLLRHIFGSPETPYVL